MTLRSLNVQQIKTNEELSSIIQVKAEHPMSIWGQTLTDSQKSSMQQISDLMKIEQYKRYFIKNIHVNLESASLI